MAPYSTWQPKTLNLRTYILKFKVRLHRRHGPNLKRGSNRDSTRLGEISPEPLFNHRVDQDTFHEYGLYADGSADNDLERLPETWPNQSPPPSYQHSENDLDHLPHPRYVSSNGHGFHQPETILEMSGEYGQQPLLVGAYLARDLNRLEHLSSTLVTLMFTVVGGGSWTGVGVNDIGTPWPILSKRVIDDMGAAGRMIPIKQLSSVPTSHGDLAISWMIDLKWSLNVCLGETPKSGEERFCISEDLQSGVGFYLPQWFLETSGSRDELARQRILGFKLPTEPRKSDIPTTRALGTPNSKDLQVPTDLDAEQLVVSSNLDPSTPSLAPKEVPGNHTTTRVYCPPSLSPSCDRTEENESLSLTTMSNPSASATQVLPSLAPECSPNVGLNLHMDEVQHIASTWNSTSPIDTTRLSAESETEDKNNGGYPKDLDDAATCTDVITVAHPNRWVARQVGVAKIRIEHLSLSTQQRQCEVNSSSLDNFSVLLDEDDGSVKRAALLPEIPRHEATISIALEKASEVQSAPQAGHGTSGSSEPPASSTSLPVSSSEGLHSFPIPPMLHDENGDDDGGRRKKRRHSGGSSTPNTVFPGLRLACPYQAYEPWRGCLRREPARNPLGGCDGISRLKQHLARRHMASYRCPRCWISCDTRLKAGVHAENTNCNARDRPLNDCFMDTSHEREVEGKFRRATPEEIWWSLFRLLVPQTEHIDDSRLKLMFSPYYLTQGIVPGSSLMVSPVMIPGNVLHSLQLATCQWGTDGNEGQNLHRTIGLDSIPIDAALLADASFNPPLSDSSLLSPSFSVPVYEAFLPESSESAATPMASSIFSRHSAQFESQTDLSSSTAGLSLDALPTRSALSPEPCLGTAQIPRPPINTPPASTSGQPAQIEQLQRNHERLLKRIAQTEAENETLRETNRENRADLSRVERLLEELLATGDLNTKVFETVTLVAESLMIVKKRMC